MADWHVDVPTPLTYGYLTYTEGPHSADCWYESAAGGDRVFLICTDKGWDLHHPWAAGRQAEILDRVADAFIQRGDPAWRKCADRSEPDIVFIKLDCQVGMDRAERDGVVEFSEGPRSLTLRLNRGQNRIAFIIVGPKEEEWSAFNVHVPNRRHGVLARVADEVIRILAPGCIPHYEESSPNEMQIRLPSTASGGEDAA